MAGLLARRNQIWQGKSMGTLRVTGLAGWLAALVMLVGIGATSPASAQQIQLPPGLDPENAILLEMKTGPVIIEMYADKAPQHVERIRTLTRQGFYNGVIFHRVIENFMAQTGDPTGTGRGGSPLPDLPAEFNSTKHARGTVAMARASDPNSANSQFFIVYNDAPHLDGKYTAWGRVVHGMELVEAVPKGEPPAAPARIERAMVLTDVFKAMGVDPAEAMKQAQAGGQRPAGAQPDFEMPTIPDDLDIDAPVLVKK
jgi:peptidylprolyl isomerase